MWRFLLVAKPISSPVLYKTANSFLHLLARVCALTIALALPTPCSAQQSVLRRAVTCPDGYSIDLAGRCRTFRSNPPTLQPSNGGACPKDYIDVGGNYCAPG